MENLGCRKDNLIPSKKSWLLPVGLTNHSFKASRRTHYLISIGNLHGDDY